MFKSELLNCTSVRNFSACRCEPSHVCYFSESSINQNGVLNAEPGGFFMEKKEGAACPQHSKQAKIRKVCGRCKVLVFSQRGKSQQLRPRISRNPWQWRICVRNHTACSSSVFAIYSQTLPSHSTRYTVPLIGECGKHAPSSLGSEWWLDAPGKADGPPVATSCVLPVRLRHNQGRYRKEERTPKYEGQCSMSPHIARTDALVDVGCLLFFLPGRWCTPLLSLEASH